jgi:hypothetical protein
MRILLRMARWRASLHGVVRQMSADDKQTAVQSDTNIPDRENDVKIYISKYRKIGDGFVGRQ